MTPQTENVKPAGVNSEAYLADISGLVWPFIGNAFDKTFSRMVMENAAMLPAQSDGLLCMLLSAQACSDKGSLRSWMPRRIGCAVSR